jgi:hypothetical protein
VAHYRLSPTDWPDFRAVVRETLSDGRLTLPELGRQCLHTVRTGT